MKTLLTLLALCLILSCSEQQEGTVIKFDPITSVENNLIPPVYIEGDSTWNIEDRMRHYGVPGLSVAVIHDGKIAWVKTYGITDKDSKESVTENTLFQAASISKPISAYAALRLVEKGKIDLTADINSQLRSWKLEENEFTKEKKVNVKNLLNHSAGITVHGFLGYSPDLPVPTLTQVLNGEEPANSEPARVDKVPEESYRYSGGGYNIVQQLMIDIEGRSFPEIMDSLVLHPLNMTKSTYQQPLPPQKLKYAATGYLPDGTMTKGKRHTYPEMAPAGLWTTSEDIAKFALNIQKTLSGEETKLLSQKMTNEMLSPFVEDFIGLGIFIRQRKDEVYFGHGGWNEGFSSDLVAHKDKGYGAAIMINSNHPAFIDELMRSIALTYKWESYFPIYEKMTEEKAADSNIIGKYLVQGHDYMEIVERDGQLLYKDGPEEKGVDFVKVSDSTYVVRSIDVLFKISKATESDSVNLQVIDSNSLEIRSSYTKYQGDSLLPIDVLLYQGFDKALDNYQLLKNINPNHPAVNEDNLNNMGYRFLGKENFEMAKHLFEINMMLYPESFNVYDSYAEACMELGEDQEAIKYYLKSLDLNPDNDNANYQMDKIKARQAN